jgi:hypothetical protein
MEERVTFAVRAFWSSGAQESKVAKLQKRLRDRTI